MNIRKLFYFFNQNFRERDWKNVSQDCKDFIDNLLAYHEDKRWSAEQAL